MCCWERERGADTSEPAEQSGTVARQTSPRAGRKDGGEILGVSRNNPHRSPHAGRKDGGESLGGGHIAEENAGRLRQGRRILRHFTTRQPPITPRGVLAVSVDLQAERLHTSSGAAQDVARVPAGSGERVEECADEQIDSRLGAAGWEKACQH